MSYFLWYPWRKCKVGKNAILGLSRAEMVRNTCCQSNRVSFTYDMTGMCTATDCSIHLHCIATSVQITVLMMCLISTDEMTGLYLISDLISCLKIPQRYCILHYIVGLLFWRLGCGVHNFSVNANCNLKLGSCFIF